LYKDDIISVGRESRIEINKRVREGQSIVGQHKNIGLGLMITTIALATISDEKNGAI
jgi:hypothetical protein